MTTPSYEAPFVFGVCAEGETFTDRVEETEHLRQNFLHGVNTILVSPRRMGKTSLVERVCPLAQQCDPRLRIARIDAFGCRSETDFLQAFAAAVVRATSSRWEEWMETAKRFLARFRPKLSVDTPAGQEVSVQLELRPSQADAADLLNLPELIAAEKGLRMVVCVDEFQQLGEFADSLAFQKKVRGVWQLQRHVCYCLYGSKRHMMENLFQREAAPFYRFGDTLYLRKIPLADWVPFICRRFRQTGKRISPELAERICRQTQCYSSYVQQLSWLVWLRAGEQATEADVEYATDRLLDSCEPLFVQQTESLSYYQMNFLRALCDGQRSGFTLSSTLSTYQLGTSANVSRLKRSLLEKDLITVCGPRELEMADPVLALWLRRRVWRQR